ncbi:MAG: hypothetical protein LLH30_00315 [Candidatus Manganitrophus sp. SA1]|nr:hypothetical protein [Candidatus Manganitrophus morganii]
MIIQKLKKVIPVRHTMFNKLTHGKPYRFKNWKMDHNGQECLYYEFNGTKGRRHSKRIPISEIKAAATYLKQNNVFDRTTFNAICPIASSGGPCSFAVLGRCLEYLGLATYQGRGKGFAL